MITRKLIAFWIAIPGVIWTLMWALYATKLSMMDALGVVGGSLLVTALLVAFWPRRASK